MSLDRRIVVAVLAGLLGLVSACGPADRPEMRGGLYFAAGQYLAMLDLRDGSTSVVANLGDVEIQEINPQNDERLLLTVFGNVNQQDTHRLVLYDIASRQTLTLLNGREGGYLPGTRILVYDDGLRIVVAEKISGVWEKHEVMQHRFNSPLRIMPITASRFLYAEQQAPIHVYDNGSKRSIELTRLSELCSLDGSLWMPEREHLLCRRTRDDGVYEYQFVGLDGTVHESLPLPGSQAFRPVAWLPDQDALVLTERWSSWLSGKQKSAIWIYRFDDGDLYRLIDDQYLGSSVVYEPGDSGWARPRE